MQLAYEIARRQITVAHKSRRHLLWQLPQPVSINLTRLDVTVWDRPVLPYRNAMLHQGFRIPQIAVRDGSRRKQSSHIGNLPVSHVEQVIRHAVGSIITVRNDRIRICLLVAEIHIQNRDFCFFIQKVQIFSRQTSDDNQTVRLLLLHKLRHLEGSLHLRADHFHQRKTFLCHRARRYLLIHLQIEGIVLIQPALGNQHTDIIAFYRVFAPPGGRLFVSHLIGKCFYLLPQFFADAFLSGQRLRYGNCTHAKLSRNICQLYRFCHFSNLQLLFIRHLG